MLNNMADAYGITVRAEKVKVLQKVLAVLIVVSLYISKQINLTNYFYFQYLILLFLIISFLYIMKREGHLVGQRLFIAYDKVKKYLKEFYNYSHPLVVYSFIGAFVNIFDRWLLQVFGGSVQQGFFGFSFQISALCFLFAGALTPLLMREFSISYAKEDMKEMSRLFQRYLPVLLFITAFLTCFIASQAGTIVQIMGGEKYKNSLWPVFIMAFYPIYQVHGQVCGSVFFATDETKLYCNIGIFFMLIGIPITYFFIAPKALWGLDSGATGLAAKMMLIQILGINVLLYHNAKILKFSLRKHLFNQVINIALLLIFAFLASFAANFMLSFFGNTILKFFFAGLVYTAAVAAVIYFFPGIFTLRKDDINNALQIGLRKLKNMVNPGFFIRPFF
jgi:O-antigen/teichoic acid export membrane protein